MTSKSVSESWTAASRNTESLQTHIVQFETMRKVLTEQIDDARGRQQESTALGEDLTQAGQVLQRLEGDYRRNLEEALASLVSRGLTAVFGEPLVLKVQNRLVRDVLSTELTLVVGEGAGQIETKVLNASGGSVVNVLSLLLRALLVVSTRPPLRRLIILDEAFNFLDEYSHSQGVGTLLHELAERLGIQFILVTHSQQLVEYSDIAYEVTRHGTQPAKISQLPTSLAGETL